MSEHGFVPLVIADGRSSNVLEFIPGESAASATNSKRVQGVRARRGLPRGWAAQAVWRASVVPDVDVVVLSEDEMVARR